MPAKHLRLHATAATMNQTGCSICHPSSSSSVSTDAAAAHHTFALLQHAAAASAAKSSISSSHTPSQPRTRSICSSLQPRMMCCSDPGVMSSMRSSVRDVKHCAAVKSQMASAMGADRSHRRPS
jgi:hypothetical protein